MLALLSDLVCFSVAATPGTWTKVFDQDPATLIDIFLFTNVFACFLEPYLVRRFGLRIPIVGAAALMAVGCMLRSGVPFVGEQLPTYAVVVAGTMMVAVAQPFFQCTPPLLSATWFAKDERSLATAVAINFNQVGIAAAFLVGGAMGGSEGGLKEYFGFITIASVLVAVASLIFFQERPPSPPSFSALEKAEAAEGNSEEDISFPEQAVQLFRTPGFVPPLAAFVVSISVTNVVGAFMEQKLGRAGILDQGTVDLSGAGFELAIVVGGIILGGIVDRNKEYKNVTLACLAATLAGVLLFGFGGQMPHGLVIVALLAVGAFAGPVQPINAELAVEVTYPADENAIEAVQQLCGNLVSALLVPLCEYAARWDVSMPSMQALFGGQPMAGTSSPGVGSLQGDTVVLVAFVAVVGLYFSTFDAPLRRTEVDNENCMTPS
uniref:Major facilitator superfamily (MFS) profile domain-containing protein n=1 Tax=Alexandrium catenella TaxID=2925 RepID=A0A7S1QE27_ALECA